jgi:Zn-dependent peptidase ImmA (M78 family)
MERRYPLNIRKIIAGRLYSEFKRRGLNASDVAKQVLLNPQKIERYLKGKEEIKLNEVSSICEAIGVNPIRLIYSIEYPFSKLHYRNLNLEVQKIAAGIEDVFLTLYDCLPEIDIGPIQSFKRQINDFTPEGLLVGAGVAAEEVFQKFNKPEKIIEATGIPVFSIPLGKDSFDGFLISCQEKYAIFLNRNKPPQRIIFTLCHEISHLIYDREEDVSVDIFRPNLFKQEYKKDEISEFFAYKFAQFYLLPFKKFSSYIIKKWPDLDWEKVQKLVNQKRVSRDVLINSIFDVLKLNNQAGYPEKHVYESSKEENGHEGEVTGDQFKRMEEEEQVEEIWKDNPFSGAFFRQVSPKSTREQVKFYCEPIKSSSNAVEIFEILDKWNGLAAKNIKERKKLFSQQVINHFEGVLKIALR